MELSRRSRRRPIGPRPKFRYGLAGSMQSSQSLPCPKCGNLAPEKVSERRGDLSGAFVEKSFRCKCGTTFTQSESKNETLAAKADRLQRKIGGIVDDPNGIFVGNDGEKCIAELRAVSIQCEAEGLSVVAQRLNQLATDVMRRWSE
jgi:hypothetical protein